MSVALFVSPHQDDETLSMGMAIKNHLLAGVSVYIMEVTNGQASIGYNILRGSVRCTTPGCPKVNQYHNPGEYNTDGNASSLSPAEFTEIRNKEQIDAASALGVSSSHISYLNIADGSVSQDANLTKLYNAIASFVSAHGGKSNVAIKTTSASDTAIDHKGCAQTVRKLATNGVISNPRFYVSPEHWVVSSIYDPTVGTVSVTREYNSSGVTAFTNALNRYYTPIDLVTRFGVGKHSVQNLFDTVLGNKSSYYHA